MKKRNGFTLIEILASMAIIALVFGIAVPTYLFVTNNVKEKSYQNKITYVLTKAESWASDTGRDVTNIAHLIEEGYVEADDEHGAYNNPIDNSSMLCYTIRVNYENNQYAAYLSDEEYCSYEELEKQTSIVELVKIDTSGNIIGENDWSRDNILLRVQFKDEENRNKFQNSVQEITWNGNSHVENVAVNGDFSSKNQYSVVASQFMNTKYEVTVKIVHEGKTYIYKAYSQVRIDRQQPIIYQDDVSVDHFDDWQNGSKDVHIVASDFDGAGVYGYYINENNSTCSTNKSSYQQVTSLNFTVPLKQGEYYACVMDNVGNVSEPAKITVIKTDDVAPRLGDFTIASSKKGVKYYSELSLRVQVIDELSGANALRYCIGTSECAPNSTHKVDANGYITIPFTTANALAQKICAIGIDNAGNESEVKCSDAYFYDNTNPVIKSLEVPFENHKYVARFSAEDLESGIYSYELYLGTSTDNYSKIAELVTTNTSESVELKDLRANTTYYVKLVVTNQAGLTVEKEYSFLAKFIMADAQYYCDLKDGYCDKGIYVSYGGHIFALYRATESSTFGVNVSKDMKISLIQSHCCDQGVCHIQYVYDTMYSGIYGSGSHTLKSYYDKLNATDTYLNLETYSFGQAPNISTYTYQQVTTKMVRYGLLDLSEYSHIYSKSYMNDLSTLLSTVYPHCTSSDHYICAENNDNIMAILAKNGSLTTKSAVTGPSRDWYYDAAMTLPFKSTLTLTGGLGTMEDPYTIE